MLPEALSQSIQDRFGVSETLLEHILAKRTITNPAPKEWEDLTNGSEMDKAYLHFALSTVRRGEQSRDYMFRECGNPGGRYLDVGCAYGGFVIAFANAGYDAVGVEISDEWAKIGQAATAHLDNADVMLKDFYDLADSDGFSVITCNDVIEHVADPKAAINKIANLLVPGGYAYFAIPNRTSVKHVQRDGHFGLAGHALLNHHAARAYYDAHRHKFKGRAYSCGEMYPLEWYMDVASRAGLTPVEKRPERVQRDKIVDTFQKAREAILAGSDFSSCEQILQDEIRTEFAKYAGRFHAELARFDLDLPNTLVRDYGADFWYVVAEKPG